MNKKKYNTTGFAVGLLVASVLPSAALGQGLVLEEVTVTATKRAEGLQDIPIALSVMSGEKITEQGIGNLEELAAFMPNVHISQTMGGDGLFIRGIGSGENFGFEQSVGSFVDGLYFGRGQSSRSKFLDIERVEILKGPQSTLFGKNTVAGAINITTARPTEELEGRVELSAEPEFGAWSVTGAMSGEVFNRVNARLVLKTEESDGYMDNTLLARDEPQEDSTIARLSVDWLLNDSIDVLLKYEYGESDTLGRQNTITIATAESTAIYRTGDPDFSADFGYDKSAQGITTASKNDQFHDSQWSIASATVQWSLGEHTLRSITGYVDYEFDSNIDADIGPLRFLARGREETHSQFSQEFLLASALGQEFEYLLGAYYQTEDLDSDRTTDAALSAIGLGGGTLDATAIGEFEQETTTYSTFAQVTWNTSQALRVIAGLRYTVDEKKFTKFQYVADIFTNDANERLGGIFDGVLNFLTDHSFTGEGATRCVGVDYVCTLDPGFDNSRDESHVTGDLTLQWDAADAVMVYAKISTGYKAGGFDEENALGVADVEEFEDESVLAFELGTKMDLLEGRGRLNIAIFRSEFEDVQVSTFDGSSSFVVGNAAESESQGIELDGSILLSESFRLNVGLAYLDASYSSFDDAACTNAQAIAFAQAGGERNGCLQDLSGKPLQYAPDYSGNAAIEYFTELGPNMEFRASLEMQYSDYFEIASDLDDSVAQDSFTKWNGRVSLSDLEQRWSMAVVFKNITDETTTSFGGDVPLQDLGFDGTYMQLLEPPRSVEFQAIFSF